MSDAKLVNLAKLMTTYNFEIEQLPDNLKCTQCKLVLKDACQVPCGCTYCRACIDGMMVKGSEICQGDSEDCAESLLSSYQSDYSSNRRVLKLTVKCPLDGCVHECQLTNIEEHLRECSIKSEESSLRELGCTQDKLAAEEMSGNSEILFGMIANMNREIETLKQRDEASSKEIETLKHELVQIRSILDQMILAQNQNELMKNEIKSIKEEKEDLASRVRILTEEIEKEVDERRQNDELDMAKVIEHVDKEVAAGTGLIGSNKNESVIEIPSVRHDVGSIKQDTELIKEDICPVKPQVESIQPPLGQVDARFEWLFDDDIGKTGWVIRQSEYFTGEVHQYKYRLTSQNLDIGIPRAVLCFQLRIYAGSNDGQLQWPLVGRMTITITDRMKHEVCTSIAQRYQIEKTLQRSNSTISSSSTEKRQSFIDTKNYRNCDKFEFLHTELIKAGLDLSCGVRVSCVIVPGTD